MQDRYKYKAYHKPTKTLFDVYGFNEDFVFADTLDGVGTQFNPARMDDCELVQCTGLKDKNGKLIYEGDITKDERRLFYIKYKNGAFIYFFKNIGGILTELPMYPPINATMEVIGNIYENKDLLKELEQC